MTSDLPRPRAVVRAPAASLGAMRTTCSPRLSRKRSSAPETWRQSSSAHTRSASRPRAQTRRSSNARRRALTVLSPISRPVAASTAATVCDCSWVSAPITIIYHRPLVGISDEQIAGGHISVGAMPRLYQVMPKILGRRRATQHPSVRPAGRQKVNESARRQPGTYRPRRTPPPDARKSRTEKVKGLSLDRGRLCAGLRPSVRPRGRLRGASDRLLWRRFRLIGHRWRDPADFGRAGPPPAVAGGREMPGDRWADGGRR